jgi:muconolactone delta-isomerase
MKILALLTPKQDSTPGDFERHIVQEEQAVWAAYANGDLREMYFQAEPLAVTLVFEANDKVEVRTILKNFPMVAAQLFDIELVTLGYWAPFAPFITNNATNKSLEVRSVS